MKKGIIGFIIGVVATLGLVLCFYAGMQFAKKEDKKDTKTEEKEPAKKPEKVEGKIDLDIDHDEVVEARRAFPFALCHEYILRLDGKSRKVSELKDTEKLAMVINYYTEELFNNDSDDGDYRMELSESQIKRLFEDTSFLKKLDDDQYAIDARVIQKENGKYILTAYPTGCVADEYEGANMTLYKAYKEDDKLVLVYAYAWEVTKFNEKIDDFEVTYYKAKGDKSVVVKNPEFDDNIQEYKVDWSKFNTYEFVYDISDGNLRIQEINFVKAK